MRAVLISVATSVAVVADGGKKLAMMVVVLLILEIAAKGTQISKSDEKVSSGFAEVG